MRLVAWIGVAVLGGSAVLAGEARAQASRFNGTWSVEVVTERGACDRAYRYSIIVENGRVRYGGQEAFNVTGRVQPNGAVRGSIARAGPRRRHRPPRGPHRRRHLGHLGVAQLRRHLERREAGVRRPPGPAAPSGGLAPAEALE